MQSPDKSSESSKRELGGLRGAGIDLLGLARGIMQLVLSSGNSFTGLWSIDGGTADDDDLLPEDVVSRTIGGILDNILLGELPIDSAGKLLDGARVPIEMMTVGGTPVMVDWDGEHVTVTDPLGTKAIVTGVISHGPRMISCATNRWLMGGEWLDPRPLPPGTVTRNNPIATSARVSLCSIVGRWDLFELRSGNGASVSVRSRIATEQLRERALEQQLFRVRCEMEAEIPAPGRRSFSDAINDFEDLLVIKLALAAPATMELAVVTKRRSCDFYFCACDASSLGAALNRMPRFGLKVSLTQLVGETARVLDQLVPQRSIDHK